MSTRSILISLACCFFLIPLKAGNFDSPRATLETIEGALASNDETTFRSAFLYDANNQEFVSALFRLSLAEILFQKLLTSKNGANAYSEFQETKTHATAHLIIHPPGPPGWADRAKIDEQSDEATCTINGQTEFALQRTRTGWKFDVGLGLKGSNPNSLIPLMSVITNVVEYGTALLQKGPIQTASLKELMDAHFTDLFGIMHLTQS